MTATARKPHGRVLTLPPTNGGSTVKPKVDNKSPLEGGEFEAFIRRCIRSWARAGGDGNPSALAHLRGVRAEADRALGVTARALHDQHGYSWTEIAGWLGISRQAAHQRWGRQ